MRSFSDRFIGHIDQALRTIHGVLPPAARPSPAAADNHTDTALDNGMRDHSMRLMRVNHAGELAAQGLYHGQSLFARAPAVRQAMQHAADEENDHLHWCADRVDELGGHTSRLAPLWYLGSLGMGAMASAIGDGWSLGFVAATEHQVTAHLDRHLQALPDADQTSRAIVQQMRQDEQQHARQAERSGGKKLPHAVQTAMGLTSKVMTRLAYRI